MHRPARPSAAIPPQNYKVPTPRRERPGTKRAGRAEKKYVANGAKSVFRAQKKEKNRTDRAAQIRLKTTAKIKVHAPSRFPARNEKEIFPPKENCPRACSAFRTGITVRRLSRKEITAAGAQKNRPALFLYCFRSCTLFYCFLFSRVRPLFFYAPPLPVLQEREKVRDECKQGPQNGQRKSQNGDFSA